MDIWFFRTLIKGYFRGEYHPQVLKKDATSSGLQIIGLLLVNHYLASMANFMGTSYTDVYTVNSIIFNNNIQSIFTFVNERLVPFLAQHPYDRDHLNAFFMEDYINFTVKDLTESFQAAMLALALPLVTIDGGFGLGVSKNKRFPVMLNKCYHFVRFTRLFKELDLPLNLFANRSAIKTQLMTVASPKNS